jgi:hypothetical protein
MGGCLVTNWLSFARELFCWPLLRKRYLFIRLLRSNGCTSCPLRGLCPATGLYARTYYNGFVWYLLVDTEGSMLLGNIGGLLLVYTAPYNWKWVLLNNSTPLFFFILHRFIRTRCMLCIRYVFHWPVIHMGSGTRAAKCQSHRNNGKPLRTDTITVPCCLSSTEAIIYMSLVQNNLFDRKWHQCSRSPYSEL